MIDLNSTQPFFCWTFDSFEDLKQERRKQGFGDSVWKRLEIPSAAVGNDHVTFDSPEEWGEDPPFYKFERTPDGLYEHRQDGLIYTAVRSDTDSHVVLTGTWIEANYGKGSFIAVFPSRHVG